MGSAISLAHVRAAEQHCSQQEKRRAQSGRVHAQQAVFLNPGTLPLWLAGLFWLFGSLDGRRYRIIGII